HALWPDVEAAALVVVGLAGNFPDAPDAFALVETLVEDVVLAEVALGPVALAVPDAVATADEEAPDPVAPLALDDAAAKGEAQLREVAPGGEPLQEIARPGPAREARVGLQLCGAHCGFLRGLDGSRPLYAPAGEPLWPELRARGQSAPDTAEHELSRS